MKKTFKILGTIFGVIVLALAGLISWVSLSFPKVSEPEQIKVELTPMNIEHGKYLAQSVLVCMDCHSTRDWSKYSGPLVPNTLGLGGEVFSAADGFPGDFSAKNLTPSHLKDWSDGEILRAMAAGVNKKGQALFPVMPWHNYGKMDKSDMLAVIAYLRTLPALENNSIPESKAKFPFSLILKTLPHDPQYKARPKNTDTLAYGEYLTTAASCNDCHTQQNKGKPLEGMGFAGGFKFNLKSGGKAVSANITPDKNTGIGNWTSQQFIGRFKAYNAKMPDVQKNQPNTVMPWTMYASMTDEDLNAIYVYLKSLKPIDNKVTHFISE